MDIVYFVAPIDLDSELANREHWKILLGEIYRYFIQNPLDFEFSTVFCQLKSRQLVGIMQGLHQRNNFRVMFFPAATFI